MQCTILSNLVFFCKVQANELWSCYEYMVHNISLGWRKKINNIYFKINYAIIFREPKPWTATYFHFLGLSVLLSSNRFHESNYPHELNKRKTLEIVSISNKTAGKPTNLYQLLSVAVAVKSSKRFQSISFCRNFCIAFEVIRSWTQLKICFNRSKLAKFGFSVRKTIWRHIIFSKATITCSHFLKLNSECLK